MTCRRSLTVSCLAVVLCASISGTASAQIRRTAWGLTATFTPNWSVPDYQRPLLDIEASTAEGQELTLGFVRGRMTRGHWGIAYVRRTVEAGGTVERLDAGTLVRQTAQSVQLHGVEVNGFAPVATFGERAQLGVFLGGGVGRWKGTVDWSRDDVPTSTGTSATGFLLMSPFEDVVPLLRVELGGTAILQPTLKLRFSGGVAFPGAHVFRVGVIYFFDVG